MNDLYRELTRRFTGQLAHRRIPTGWIIAAPQLAGHRTLMDLATAARQCRDHPDRSDQTVRGLLAIDQPDARETLLWALAPILRTRLASNGAKTRDYLNDSLTELALVVAEADPDRETGSQVAYRLVNRARGRNHKTYQRQTTIEQRSEPLPAQDHGSGPAVAPDCAEDALARLQLDQLRQAIEAARAAGLITPEQWAAYRQDLTQQINGSHTGPTSSGTRMRRHRTRKAVHRAIGTVGYDHAA